MRLKRGTELCLVVDYFSWSASSQSTAAARFWNTARLLSPMFLYSVVVHVRIFFSYFFFKESHMHLVTCNSTHSETPVFVFMSLLKVRESISCVTCLARLCSSCRLFPPRSIYTSPPHWRAGMRFVGSGVSYNLPLYVSCLFSCVSSVSANLKMND